MRVSISRILLVLIAVLSIPSRAVADGVPSGDIVNAAKEGITTFLKESRSKHLHRLGFESQYDIDNAELGEGFQIFTIPPSALLDDSVPQDLQNLVIPTKQWYFFILAGGKAKTLLTVDFVDGKWTPVSIGASGLAKELRGLLDVWPATSGYQYRFIRVYQAASDFIELSQEGTNIGLIPITSQIAAIKRGAREAFDPHDLRDLNEVLSGLRPIVRQNMQLEQ